MVVKSGKAGLFYQPCHAVAPLCHLSCFAASVSLLIGSGRIAARGSLRTPQQVLGFRVGADNRLARWDSIVDYMKLAAAGSERVRYREIGRTGGGNPLIVLEISAPETARESRPLTSRWSASCTSRTARRRKANATQIFRQGKLVLLVTCSIHANEVGASQMSLELVHRLASDDSRP